MNENTDGGGAKPLSFKLAPLSVEQEVCLAALAVRFFSLAENKEFRKVLGSTGSENAMTPLSGHEFLRYLDKSNFLPDGPFEYAHQIRRLLDRMAANDILTEAGTAYNNPLLPKKYFSWLEFQTSRLQRTGVLWLAKTLARILHQCSCGTAEYPR